MLASEVKALIAGLVVVSTAGVGAALWRQQHPDAPGIAALFSPAPEPVKPPPLISPPQTASLGTAPADSKSEPAAGTGEPPHFDVVRVEPSGEAVVAGKGDPNAKVQLLASGKVVAETKADANGHFVLLPPPLLPGNHALTLRQSAGANPPADSTESVAVSIPAKGSGQVVVALAEPGKPTKLLSGPPATAAANPEAANPDRSKQDTSKQETSKQETAMAKPDPGAPPAAIKRADHGLAIRSVELENGNGFFASGAAAPGTRVQIYLNGAHLADVVAGPDGQWSVTLKKGLTGGHYAVRADAGERDKVTARVEVPFDVPVAMAAAPQSSAPASSPPSEPGPAPPSAPNPADVAGLGPPPMQQGTAPAPVAPPPGLAPSAVPRSDLAARSAAIAAMPGANAVIDEVDTALVVPGDNLWNISRVRLGHGRRFTEVYAANVSQIRDPKLIYPGQVFVVPAK